MNLSKILVSVNIAATLPIAVQVAAQASNQSPEAGSKDSANTLSVQARSSSQVSVAKKSFNLAKSNPSSVEVDGVKLRAFMPGRKLPSSSAPLVSQQAQLAPELPPIQSSLNGSVTESSARNTYGQQSPYASAAPRVVMNQIQAVARQIKQAAKKRAAGEVRPTSIAPVTASKSQSTSVDFGQFSKDIPASWMANEKNLSLIETPTPTAQDMAQVDRMMEQQRPAEATGTAGPPPFPLNLLPQQSLKQFVGSSAGAGAPRPQQVRAPQASFGSWAHQGNRISAALPPAGFHSNLHGGHFGSYIAPHAGHKFAAGNFKQQNKMLIAQAPHTVTAPNVKVAAYAPYATTKAF